MIYPSLNIFKEEEEEEIAHVSNISKRERRKSCKKEFHNLYVITSTYSRASVHLNVTTPSEIIPYYRLNHSIW
jgi:hypothetical protein